MRRPRLSDGMKSRSRVVKRQTMKLSRDFAAGTFGRAWPPGLTVRRCAKSRHKWKRARFALRHEKLSPQLLNRRAANHRHRMAHFLAKNLDGAVSSRTSARHDAI